METQPIQTQQATRASNEHRITGVALISVLIALMLTLLLEALDQTVVGTALPKIIGELQGFDRYTWAITAYTLGSTIMIPIVGKLSDQFGRKWFLVSGTIIFLLGSALSGASQTMNQLIAFRALQGLGAGMGIALVFVVIADLFTPAERVRWQSMFGVVYGLSNLIGPSLGGYLTDHGPLVGTLVTDATRWRWVFYLNVPIGILALIALLVFLPAHHSSAPRQYTGWAAIRRIDFPGALLSATATICLLLGLTWGSNEIYAWNSVNVIGILVCAAILYIVFVIVERFAAEPVLPLGLFGNQIYAVAAFLSMLQMMVLIGLITYLPLFLQGVLNVSATNAGAVITPMTISAVIGSSLSGFIISLIKRYQIITIVAALFMTTGVYLLSRMTPTTALPLTVVFMIIAGLGLGPFFSVLTIAAQNALPRERMGIGTSALRYLGQLGAVLGVALVGTVVNNTLDNDITKRLPANAVQQLTPAGVKAATNPQVLTNQDYRNTLVNTAKHYAAQGASAHVPPGPQHDQIAATAAAQAMQQAQHMLDQVFAALRLSLAVAIQHGLVAILIISSTLLVTTFFLKDLPIVQRKDRKSAEAEMSDESNFSPIP